MREAITDASEELKRVDHLIYVSLKYTRSVDVIRNVIERMINCTEFLLDALLIDAEEEGKISGVPTLAVEKCNLVRQTYKDDTGILAIAEFHSRLRKIMRAKYTRAQEFRRHVTMGIVIDDAPLDVHIDLVHEYYETLKEYFDIVFEKLKEHEAKKEG